MLRNDAEPAMTMLMTEGVDSTWGAWGEVSESGKLLLALPGDSTAPSVAASRVASRQPSGNERSSYTSLGAVSIRRSLGGNLLFGSRITRASRTSGHDGVVAQRISCAGRPMSMAGSSRFGSMRAAAYAATQQGDSERSSLRTATSGDAAAVAAAQLHQQQRGAVIAAADVLPAAPGCGGTHPMTAANVQRLQEVLEVVREGSMSSMVTTPVGSLRVGLQGGGGDDGGGGERTTAEGGRGSAVSDPRSSIALSSGTTVPPTPTAWGAAPPALSSPTRHSPLHPNDGMLTSPARASPGRLPPLAHAAAGQSVVLGETSQDDSGIWMQVRKVAVAEQIGAHNCSE